MWKDICDIESSPSGISSVHAPSSFPLEIHQRRTLSRDASLPVLYTGKDYQRSSSYRGGRQKEKPPPHMTSEERATWEKERYKKDNHNESRRLKAILTLRTSEAGISTLHKLPYGVRRHGSQRQAPEVSIPSARYYNARRQKSVYRLCFLLRTGTGMPDS